MNQITILNYQGNKTSLIPFINEHISKYVSAGDTICDIFAGSGSVGAFLKDEHPIISNDVELYSTIISDALLNTPLKEELILAKKMFMSGLKNNLKSNILPNESIVARERAYILQGENSELIELYNTIPTIWNGIDKNITPAILSNKNRYELFLRYYSGTYFGIEQSISIDSIIQTIHEMECESTKNVLFSCLFYALKETVFSKDGHMAQPLNIKKNMERHIKQRGKNAIDYFLLKLNEFIEKAPIKFKKHKNYIFNCEISKLLENEKFKDKNIKLIYADPPYTDMQYSRYYHILNVAAKYDYPEPTISRGQFTKGLYTEGRNQSELSKKSTARSKLQELFNFCKENQIMLALSYAFPKDKIIQKTDRYTISIEELVSMAKDTFGNKRVQIEEEDYKHANHRNSSTKDVLEYLIICGQEIQKSKFDLVSLKQEIKQLTPTSKNPIYDTHLYWSQKSFNVIDALIRNLSSEGDIVFDPFMGSGVTIIEAIKGNLKRRGIGCDVNEMPKFIVNNIIRDIPSSDLTKIFEDLEKKISSLTPYYETKCSKCTNTGIIDKVVFDKQVRTRNNIKIKAINYTCSACGKQIKEADNIDYIKFLTVQCDKYVPNECLMQNSKIAVGENNTLSDIFTPRNFSVLNEIVGYIKETENKNVLNYLLMSIIHLSKITDTHSNSQWPLWIPKLNCVEKNIIVLLQRRMKNLLKAQSFTSTNYADSRMVDYFNELDNNNAMVLTKGSQHITNDEIPNDSISLIITDPPYMDQVLYSEYMQLYKPFIGLDFNLKDEIIVSSAVERKRTKEEYFILLNDVFHMCSNKLKENHYMCLFFHDSNLDVWVRLIEILERNGFKFISQEHIKKSKTVKNILSPKKSLSGDAVLFFENTRVKLPVVMTTLEVNEIEYSVYLEAKKLLEKYGDLSTPELYDLGIMEMLINNGWLKKLSTKYKSLVDIFENRFIWKSEIAKWHLQV